MNKRDQIVWGKAAVIICLVLIIAFIGAISLSGCKAKVTEPKATGPVGTCEIFGKLPGDVEKTVDINYGNKVKLMGITVEKLPKNQLKLSYYWQSMDDLGSFNMVFVHFTDKSNKILFQNDHTFCQQKSFEELKGSVIKETFEVNFPKNAVGQGISIKMGLYDPKFSGRVRIESSVGIPTDDGNTRAIIEGFKL